MSERTVTDIKGKYALIDGDIIAYRCAFAAEHTYYLNEYEDPPHWEHHNDAKAANTAAKAHTLKHRWSRKEIQPVEHALQAVETSIGYILSQIKPCDVSIYLTGKDNYRDKIAVTLPYKGNRDTQQKPMHLQACRDYLVSVYNAQVVNGHEADDAIGIEHGKHGDGGVIVSIDKDLEQIAGWHYNWVDGDVRYISRRDADFHLYSQILTGDRTDNVPGLRGIGPAAAARILDGANSSLDLFNRAWGAYKRAGHSPEYFLEQADLIFIQRREQPGYEVPADGQFV